MRRLHYWTLVGAAVFAMLAAATAGGAGPPAEHMTFELDAVSAAGGASHQVDLVDGALFTPFGAGSDIEPHRLVLGRTRDGRRMVVASSGGVVSTQLDGSNPVILHSGSAANGMSEGRAAFSPNGTEVAFSVASAECVRAHGISYSCLSVYVARLDGTSTRLVADHGAYPAWSADGKSIAYFGDLGLNASPASVYVQQATGSARRLLTSDSAALPGGIAFAPQGWQLSYGCAAHLCVLRHRTGAASRYREFLAPPLLWSPDGTMIAGGGGHVDFGQELGVVSLKTGRMGLLTHDRYIGTVDSALAWSPNARRIAFQRQCFNGLPPSRCAFAVWSVAVSGRAGIRLSHDDRAWIDTRWTRSTLTYFVPSG